MAPSLLFKVYVSPLINISRFMQDFHSQMYESFYLNFISAIPRHRLEDLALASIQANSVSSISKVSMGNHGYSA